MLTNSKPKVKPFYMSLIIDTFDELVLHHKVCVFSFAELLTWIKGVFDCIWKAWKDNKVDWGPNLSIPNVLHQATTSLIAQGRKESKSNTFWCGIRTAAESQLETVTTTSYGVRLERSRTLWKAYQVYFPMDLCLFPYLIRYVCSRRFNVRTFSAYGAASPNFGLLAHVSSSVH